MPENPTPAEAEGLISTAQKLPSPTEAFYKRLLPGLKVSQALSRQPTCIMSESACSISSMASDLSGLF